MFLLEFITKEEMQNNDCWDELHFCHAFLRAWTRGRCYIKTLSVNVSSEKSSVKSCSQRNTRRFQSKIFYIKKSNEPWKVSLSTKLIPALLQCFQVFYNDFSCKESCRHEAIVWIPFYFSQQLYFNVEHMSNNTFTHKSWPLKPSPLPPLSKGLSSSIIENNEMCSLK